MVVTCRVSVAISLGARGNDRVPRAPFYVALSVGLERSIGFEHMSFDIIGQLSPFREIAT